MKIIKILITKTGLNENLYIDHCADTQGLNPKPLTR